MSVQVRRRREAAAFLSSFVGAQGELLVDTTNNRVQVHDGTTPGGWPATGAGDLPGRNAVLNGGFAVNQRVFASGTALAANVYAHDRWKAGAGGATYAFVQTVPDTIVTIAAGTLVQTIDAPNVYASAWWLTWTGTAQARVWQGSASGAFATGSKIPVAGLTVNALPVSGLAPGTIANVEFGTGTLGLVQFEAALPNAGPTRFERRHGEILFCQRYYQQGIFPLRGAAGAIGGPGGGGAAHMGTSIPPMRASPTVTLSGKIPLFNGGGNANGTSIAVNYSTSAILDLDLVIDTAGAFQGGTALVATYSSWALALSAEL